MHFIQPNCRLQFTAEDKAFILDVLGADVVSQDSLEQLLADPDTRNLLLDDDRLYHAVLDHCGCLKISCHFYFYILVRQVLRKSDLTERPVADYVAELLASFSKTRQMQLKLEGREEPVALDYVCDMMAALQTVDETTRFFIRAHIGNYSLFLTGIFPDRIRHRTERRGAPDLSYYEAMGQASFRVASDHRLARRYDLDQVYQTLADRFQDTRRALNDLGDRLVSLGDSDASRYLKPWGER